MQAAKTLASVCASLKLLEKNMYSRDKIIKCYQVSQKASNSFETKRNVLAG